MQTRGPSEAHRIIDKWEIEVLRMTWRNIHLRWFGLIKVIAFLGLKFLIHGNYIYILLLD